VRVLKAFYGVKRLHEHFSSRMNPLQLERERRPNIVPLLVERPVYDPREPKQAS
jgi:hypothetical protein